MAEKNSTARDKAQEQGRDLDAAAGDKDPAGAKQAQANAAEVRDVVDSQPAAVDGGDAAMVSVDGEDDLSSYIEDADTSVTVVLKQDVYEEFFYPGTTRPSHRLLYVKGQVVNRADLDERLSAIRAAKARGGEDNPAGIDPTTLAAGTYPGAASLVSQEQSPQGTSETK